MEQAYETNSISERIVYIDMAKGFGMVLVVITCSLVNKKARWIIGKS